MLSEYVNEKLLSLGEIKTPDLMSKVPEVVKLILLIILAPFTIFIAFFDLNELLEKDNYLNLQKGLVTEIPIYQLNKSSSQVTFEELMQIRKKNINKYSNLLISPVYNPSLYVFSKVSNKHPWFSEKSYYRDNNKEKLLEGIPVESFSLINPFLLLAPEFWGLTSWVDDGNNFDESILKLAYPKGDYPGNYPMPSDIKWDTKNKVINVSYQVTSYDEKTRVLRKNPTSLLPLDIGIVSYNARDFSLKYMQLDQEESENVKTAISFNSAVKIIDHLAVSNICHENTPCNHRSATHPIFNSLKVVNLPAKLVFNLWLDKESVLTKKPELKYVINLK